jgi:hypothetical protein
LGRKIEKVPGGKNNSAPADHGITPDAADAAPDRAIGGHKKSEAPEHLA